jgi:diphthine synthase
MLTLIGLGLYDEKDLTLRGIEVAQAAKKAYVELYTSKWHGSLKNLEKLVGKKIKILNRKDLEENSKKILDEAKKQSIVIFVPGDPLVATTHTTLIMDAKAAGIKVSIIHNASIVSAIAESGLHIYKFGPMVTVPFPEKTKNKLPESIYETIKTNKARGLHTLCLLDVVDEEKKYMMPAQAVKILLELEDKRKEGVFTGDVEIVILGKVGSKKISMFFAKASDIDSLELCDPQFVLIIPGVLHFTEKDYIEQYRNL